MIPTEPASACCALASCARPFRPRRADARYCSGPCRAQASRERRVASDPSGPRLATVPAANTGREAALARAISSLSSEIAELRERFDDQLYAGQEKEESRLLREQRATGAFKELGGRVSDLEGAFRRMATGPLVERLDEQERAILQIIIRLRHVEGVLAALGDDE